MYYKITVDKEKCIGCSACIVQCDNFELKEGKAVAKKSEVKEQGCNQEAADICPVDAITVEKR